MQSSKTTSRSLNPAYTSATLAETPPRARLHKNASAWGKAQAQHLCMRAGFGASPPVLRALHESMTREQAVELFLADAPLPPAPGAWVTTGFNLRGLTDEQRRAWNAQNRANFRELGDWVVAQMATAPFALRESLVLFWQGHFVVETVAVKVAQFMYGYSQMLRRNAMGNFRIFLKEMWRQPAMLIYLNGLQNHRRRPNENFARELLELFTMGVDQYSEDDIREAARAFTGWQVDTNTLSSFLNPRRYDAGLKTFLGQTGPYGGDEIIEIILQQPVTATFICEKLYRFFVNDEADPDRVRELATLFRDSNYDLKPVLRNIFTHDDFYDARNVGALIKSPIKLIMSTVKQLQAQDFDARYLLNASELLDQALYNPPNVAGWPGQRAWISPLTLATRAAFGESAVLGGRIDRNLDRKNLKPIQIDIMEFARTFDTDNPRELLDQWQQHLLPFALDEGAFEILLELLLDGAAEDDWSLTYQGVETRLRDTLTQLLRLPEYQLH